MKQESYLTKIRFDQKLKNSLVAKYLGNPRLFLLIVLSVITLGVFSFIELPRRLNPEINIPIVIVSSALPGASPSDVESLLTIPIEDAVSDLENISTVNSSSQQNASVITIEFTSGTDPDKAQADIQSAVDTVELPEDSLDPNVIKLNIENQPVWTFILSSKNEATLNRFSQSLKDKLENGNTIKEVQTPGLNEQEIQIILDPTAVTTYAVNPQNISSQVTANLTTFPAGSVQTENNTFSLTIDPSITTVEDIRNIVLNLNNNPVLLGEIATVQERAKPNQNLSFYAKDGGNIQPAVRFDVYKTDNADITDAAKQAEEIVSESIQENEGIYTLETVYNTAEDIDEQFNHLLRDFWIIVVLIFLALFLFLGLRQAIVAAISVPLTFLISFTVMYLSGISLNFLSMFSLLLSLGLLVDDTIVVISAMTSYYRTGKFLPYETALMVWRDFVVAIFTTTLTTVWAFLPLLLSSGIIGEFIKSIPIVVSATLLASFFVAMFITMPFIIILLKPNLPRRVIILIQILSIIVLLAVFIAIVPKGPILILEILALIAFLLVTRVIRTRLVETGKTQYKNLTRKNKQVRNFSTYANHGVISFEPISDKYKRVITNILQSGVNRRNTIIMVVIFSLFSYLLLPLGFVKNEFFPSTDYDFLYVNLELPSGTNAALTREESQKLLTELSKNEHAEFTTLDIGQGYNPESGSTGGSSNQALFTLRLVDEDERPSSIKIASDLRAQYGNYPGGTVTVTEISGGPPAGSDLQIKLFGDDLSELQIFADRVETYLDNQEGVTNVEKSIKPGTSKVVFHPDPVALATGGISKPEIGGYLRTYASGISPDTIKLTEGGDDTDITIRLSESIPAIESLSSVIIPTQSGNIRLSSLGTFTLEENPTLITRENGQRTISVSAAVTEGFNVSEVNTGLTAFADNELNLPEGYSWATGGVNEENERSVQSILQAMLLSFLLIIVTMVLQFASFRKALIVMLVIPLSISGVFIIFAITGTPLSFPALIGVLALFGIVVKNSILVVDKIKQNIDIGMDYINAIADGSSSRLEAIALTSVTAILGLIPLTLSDPLWRGLGGAIIAGLTFSGTIMLFFIPVVYYYWFKPKTRTVPGRRTAKSSKRKS